MAVPPLNPNVRIVDPETGLPTPEFMRWWQDQADTNATITVFVDAEDVSGVFDLIDDTQGAVLYRGADEWATLTPGTSGQVLTTQGAVANPVWANVAATFIQLTDTPSAYTGEAGNTVVVNGTEDGLEFGAAPGGTSTPISAAYWRFSDLTAGSLTGRSAAEFDLTDRDGATITASAVDAFTEFSATYAAEKAVDDDTGTFWSSNGVNAGEWYEFQFASATTLGGATITARNDSDSDQTPYQFDVEYSDDGVAWTTAGTTVESYSDYTAGESKTFDFTTVTVTTTAFAISEGGTGATSAAGARTNLGIRELLSSVRTYYVDGTSGSDSNDGLSSGAGAFATIQKAIDVVSDDIDLGGFDVTVSIADDTYGQVDLKTITGAGTLKLVGNTTTPSNVVIESDATFTGAIDARFITGTYSLSGIRISGGGTNEYGIWAQGPGVQIIVEEAVEFHTTSRDQILVFDTAAVNLYECEITGSAGRFLFAATNGVFNVQPPRDITLTGTPAFSTAFIETRTSSVVNLPNAVFTGSATGKRYEAKTNSVIFTDGEATTWLPGDSAGTTSDGGVYS